MALGIQTKTSNRDFLPRLQYDAKAGRFFKVERTQDTMGEWNTHKEEVPLPIRVAIDMESIEVGWMKFENGVDFQLVKVGERLPPQPSPAHRQGFYSKCYTKALGVREFTHSAKCVLAPFDALHNQWSNEKGAHPGQVPVIAFETTTPVTTGTIKKSTNYQPSMVIAEWIARPAAFDEAATDSVPPPQEAVPASQAAATNGAAQPAAGQEF